MGSRPARNRRALLLDAVVGHATVGGLSAADLASALRLSRNRASELLAGLPNRQVFTVHDSRGRVRYLPSSPPTRAQADEARARFRLACRNATASAPARHEEIRERCEQALSLVREGDIEALRASLLEHELDPVWARRAVPPRYRDDLAASILEVRAGTWMQEGRPTEALRAVDEALALRNEPADRVRLFSTRGAALRMMPGDGPSQAVRTYLEGLEQAQRVGGDRGREALRHLHAAIVAPLLALGDLGAAAEHARLSSGWVDRPGTGEGETRMRVVTNLALSGAHEAALRLLGEPDPTWTLWLKGWHARILATHLSNDVADGEYSRRLCVAWKIAAGFGFQRLLLIAAIAGRPERFHPDGWDPQSLAQLVHACGMLHGQRLGRRASECPTCRGRGPAVAARHALETEPRLQLQFFQT